MAQNDLTEKVNHNSDVRWMKFDKLRNEELGKCSKLICSQNQSMWKNSRKSIQFENPSDSCINQLLAITHEIFEAFDCNPPLEVRSVFLDMSKTCDKVWHEGLLYKLKSMAISGELYDLLENYLSGRLQRVILNGQTSSWRPILAGVPQGSILGPLLFLIYINDLPNKLKSNAKLFADDTYYR